MGLCVVKFFKEYIEIAYEIQIEGPEFSAIVPICQLNLTIESQKIHPVASLSYTEFKVLF